MIKWTVGREWTRHRTFILGGGPSLRGFDAGQLRGHGKVIAINDAGLYMCPWADILFWSDRRWLDWNAHLLHLHTGERKVARKPPHVPLDCEVHVVDFHPPGLSTDPDAVGGCCSGSSAINLAYLLGSRQIVLLGFDMNDQGNWHNHHKKASALMSHAKRFIPALEGMAPTLAKLGCQVLNATQGSALQCFPVTTLAEVLRNG